MGQQSMIGGAQVGMSAINAGASMKAAHATGKAATARSAIEWQEYHRQKLETTAQAQGDKSARARQADKDMGMLLAVMADNGAAGTLNESAFAGEIGFLEGLDITKIEGNRKRKIEALSSAQTASGWRALNIISGAGTKAQGQIWNVAKAGIKQWDSAGKGSLETELDDPGTGSTQRRKWSSAGDPVGPGANPPSVI